MTLIIPERLKIETSSFEEWKAQSFFCFAFKDIVRSFSTFHENQKYFTNHGGIYHLIAFKILYSMTTLFLKGVSQFVMLYSDILVGAHRFGVPFPKLQTFSEIFWALDIDYSQYEKTILGIFVYLFTYEVIKTKVNFCF